MIRVCIFDSESVPARFIRLLLEGPGFEVSVGSPIEMQGCDVIVADKDYNVGIPTVVYNKQRDLRQAVIEQAVQNQYQPLHDSVNEMLKLIRK